MSDQSNKVEIYRKQRNSRWLPYGIGLVTGLLFAPAAYAAETATQHCRRVGTDDALRPIPAALAPAAKRLFALRAPDSAVQRTTVFRCMEGAVLICNVGANLPCGKANTSRTLASAGQYCRENPHASFIPAYVTGHDTIYAWRCRDGGAVADGPGEPLDERGFIARLWKRAG